MLKWILMIVSQDNFSDNCQSQSLSPVLHWDLARHHWGHY